MSQRRDVFILEGDTVAEVGAKITGALRFVHESQTPVMIHWGTEPYAILTPVLRHEPARGAQGLFQGSGLLPGEEVIPASVVKAAMHRPDRDLELGPE